MKDDQLKELLSECGFHNADSPYMAMGTLNNFRDLVAAVQATLSAHWTLGDLRDANVARQQEWCPDGVFPDLAYRGNELGGETGEALNVIKKLERERHGWRGSRATVKQLGEELADVVICADLCAHKAGINLQNAVRDKFNATTREVGLTTLLAPSGCIWPDCGHDTNQVGYSPGCTGKFCPAATPTAEAFQCAHNECACRSEPHPDYVCAVPIAGRWFAIHMKWDESDPHVHVYREWYCSGRAYMLREEAAAEAQKFGKQINVEYRP